MGCFVVHGYEIVIQITFGEKNTVAIDGALIDYMLIYYASEYVVTVGAHS
jgi:hypothetical protein